MVISGEDLPCGGRSRIFSVGGSVASARAAKVSMMRLTQSSWTALRAGSIWSSYMAVTKDRTTATMLTVIWN